MLDDPGGPFQAHDSMIYNPKIYIHDIQTILNKHTNFFHLYEVKRRMFLWASASEYKYIFHFETFFSLPNVFTNPAICL